jgi:hypothetical protein
VLGRLVPGEFRQQCEGFLKQFGIQLFHLEDK